MINLKSRLKPLYHRFLNFCKLWRRIGLHCNDFTIISNNCAGGFVYQYFGIHYSTPTVGLGIHPDDYLKLMQRPSYYFSQELVFVEPNTTERYQLGEHFTYPVAKCADITIYFRHYKDKYHAQHNWERRRQRVNYKKLYFLFTENEYFHISHLHKFSELIENNDLRGVCLTSKDYLITHSLHITNVRKEEGKVIWHPDVIMGAINWKQIINKL